MNTEHNSSMVGMVYVFLGTMLSAALVSGVIWVLFATVPMPNVALPQFNLAKIPWHLSRATGTVAYLLLTGSVGWGLILSTKIVKELTPPPFALAMHNFISWLAIGLAGFHGIMLLLDSYFDFSVFDLLIPFTGPYKPLWTGFGIIALYLMLLTSMSFGWRKWLGQQRWRLLHYLTFPAYGFVTLHGLMAGTDSSNIGMRAVYLGSAAVILFLTNYRILSNQASQRTRRSSPRV